MKKSSKIKSIRAKEIFDSRGNPTIEVDLITDLGRFRASVPSGASRGKYEAIELRDGGKRYSGMGVLKAVKNVNEIIAPKLKGKDVTCQKEIDQLMINLDGTENKSKLGANAIVGVSMVVCRAGAAAKNLPLYKYISQLYLPNLSLPQPCFNIINGGAHAENELDFQEFMIVPQSVDKKSRWIKSQLMRESIQMATDIYQELKKIIKEKYSDLAINIGDEGGFAPPVRRPEEAIDLILEAVENLGYQNKIKIILDVASSQFFCGGKYKMKIGVFNQKELLNYYLDLIERYPIIGLEDPFAEDDWEGWQKINQKSKSPLSTPSKNQKLLIIGDDLLATNPERIKLAKKKKACNAAIIKLNQIGTVSEAIETAKLAKDFGWKIIVSHRSGETSDDFISDLSVGIEADFIKSGAPGPKERMAKYNRLLRIEEEIRSGSNF